MKYQIDYTLCRITSEFERKTINIDNCQNEQHAINRLHKWLNAKYKDFVSCKVISVKQIANVNDVIPDNGIFQRLKDIMNIN